MTANNTRRVTSKQVSTAVDAWLAALHTSTQTSYRQKLEAYRKWLKVRDRYAAAGRFRRDGRGKSILNVERFLVYLENEKHLGPSTVNTYLFALKSLLRKFRHYELIDWTLEIPSRPVLTYRDTSGPGHEVMMRMLQRARARMDLKGVRDYAILHLMYFLGLRCAEIRGLDMMHVEMVNPTGKPRIKVLGKRRRQREDQSLPVATAAALQTWIERRPEVPDRITKQIGPVFVTLARNRPPQRMSNLDLFLMVRALAAQVGIRTSPHKIRHRSISRAKELTSGNMSLMQTFARHARPETTMKYDDKQGDEAYHVACLLSEDAAL